MAAGLRERDEPATRHGDAQVLSPGTARPACDRPGGDAAAGDATAHDTTAHDATAHDTTTAHDATAHDTTTAHDATAHDATAHDAAKSTVATPAPPVAVVATSTERLTLGRDDEITFGRGDDVHLRVGHTPVDDSLVAPVVGAVFVRDDRVVVANRSPRLAFDIAVPHRPLLPVSPGDWHSPVDPTFTVVVQGTLRYRLDVESTVVQHRSAALSGGGPTRDANRDHAGGHGAGSASGGTAGGTAGGTTVGVPALTARQRAILDAYVAPMAEGLPPATHQQVADAIACCRQTVRLECTNIFEAFLASGVPMRDWRDARDAITDAWARHRL